MKVQLDAIESESACRGAKLNKKITFHAQKHFFLADKMHLRYFVSLVAINNRINSPACLFIFFFLKQQQRADSVSPWYRAPLSPLISRNGILADLQV